MQMKDFLAKHQLPDSYSLTAETFFSPLAATLIDKQRQKAGTLLVGINGCQGSGKTTLADYLVFQLEALGLSACVISIDDFYLTRTERQTISQSVHPLFMTRGVPGTHDISLALAVLKALSRHGTVPIPRFNKGTDDRYPKSQWQAIQAPLDIVILEGWCVAVAAQNSEELNKPVNDLERQQDAEGHWRRFINHRLQTDYAELWKQLDYKLMLKAPSFDCVYPWRWEQEKKLQQKAVHSGEKNKGIMSAAQVRHFIAHYERLTRHAITTLPMQCQTVFELDEQRQILKQINY